MKSSDKDGTPISSGTPANPGQPQKPVTTIPSPDDAAGTVTASKNGGSEQVPARAAGPKIENHGDGSATVRATPEQIRSEGFLDNLKGLDFSRVVVLVEEGTAAVLSQQWWKFLSITGELSQLFGKIGQPATAGETDVPTFPRFTASDPAQFERFDKAAAEFERARGNSYAIAPQRAMYGGSESNGPEVGFDPGSILVAVELFSKLVAALQAWRKRRNP